jgi:hypothetical protein
VAFGWAGPTATSDLRAAVDHAAERLDKEIVDLDRTRGSA